MELGVPHAPDTQTETQDQERPLSGHTGCKHRTRSVPYTGHTGRKHRTGNAPCPDTQGGSTGLGAPPARTHRTEARGTVVPRLKGCDLQTKTCRRRGGRPLRQTSGSTDRTDSRPEKDGFPTPDRTGSTGSVRRSRGALRSDDAHRRDGTHSEIF